MASFSRRCRCPDTTPEGCVRDDEWVTQFGMDGQPWRRQPRHDVSESEVSLQRGKLTVVDTLRCMYRQPPKQRLVDNGRVRHALAGSLRSCGFDLVHTPGSVSNGPHVSLVWPHGRDWGTQASEWPPDVQDEMAKCFTETATDT